ncbi:MULTISPECIES: thiamine ABC transporter substrate binding subunit [Glaesserella]|uniref:Thiamine-binding periplasmic protein n=1 Tax=Glaesserella australis TaxID=2094024 RepID=A0A328BV93_9PAST|nr:MULTISPECIES: thiamine ABC transporter substrate binding subunit [Glaesserella]AUI65085.1 thiamine ABC transporter substrate binding subunit [Glaesserella sp. 15-184]RAL18093.1 thiamine ABC transporter substrate binding subunit [Glaesserella australis]
MKFNLFPLSALALATTAFAQQPTLTVYTYDSFASEWGPGQQLEQRFEQQCQCDLKFMPFEDGVTMFNRIRLEGNKTKADVMLGIDHFLMPEAEKSGLFVEHHLQNSANNLPLAWQSKTFLPYDFGEYAFIYNKEKVVNPPKSLKELVERQDLKVIYQDPRTSTVGRGLLYWVNQVYGDQAESAWQTLAKHTVTVGKGWSETYGAFLKGESDLVLSYTTSPLYHQWHEQTDKYVAADFSEGHLVQVEVAAITRTSKQTELARQFLTFLQQPEAQKLISYHNVMKPVNNSNVDPLFNQLPTYQILEFYQPETEKVRAWLNSWQKAVSQ